MDKGDFVGKDAVVARMKGGGGVNSDIKLVYLVVESGDCDIAGGEPLFDKSGRVIGVTTSGGYGHIVEKSLGFGYVEPKFAEPNTEIMVELLGKKRAAIVTAEPVWDAKNTRLRA